MGEEGRLKLTEAPWPIDTGRLWPPYLCKHCRAMKFYYNANMAQCFYCAHVSLNWSQR